MKSLEIVKSLIASYKKPLFLAGDMNAEPESDFIKELQKDFQILSNRKSILILLPNKETMLYCRVKCKTLPDFCHICESS